MVGASLDAYHYSYPPVLLLLTTPLAPMAHVPALLAWLAAGWYAFYRALRLAMPGQGALLLASLRTVGEQHGGVMEVPELGTSWQALQAVEGQGVVIIFQSGVEDEGGSPL